MENLDAKTVQGLIAEYQENQKIASDARERNRKIADKLGTGAIYGETEYFSITPTTWGSRYSAELLRKYVPEATLQLCKVGYRKSRTVAIRAIKPKKQKAA